MGVGVGVGFPVSRVMRVAAALIVGFALLYVVLPFTTARASGFGPVDQPAPSTQEAPISQETLVQFAAAHCGAAVVDAWHAKDSAGGWFGYAPLTALPTTVRGSCRSESRHRLWMAGVGLLIAFGLLLAASTIDRRPEFGSGPSPAPAT